MYLSTSTSTEDFPEMYLSTFQVLYKLYLSTNVLKYKVLLPGSGSSPDVFLEHHMLVVCTTVSIKLVRTVQASSMHALNVNAKRNNFFQNDIIYKV